LTNTFTSVLLSLIIATAAPPGLAAVAVALLPELKPKQKHT